MIGIFKSREIKEDKNGKVYYRVKTSVKPEGEEYPISFNAFNSEHQKFADIAKAIEEGSSIDFEVEKDGKFWNLKSLKLASVPEQKAAEEMVAETFGGQTQASNDSFGDREARKQISINALSIFKSVVEGSGIPTGEIHGVMSTCYNVGKTLYEGGFEETPKASKKKAPKSEEAPEYSDEDIPF